jgi:peroxiredoxin
MQEENSLTFTVVSDPGNGIAARLGILLESRNRACAAGSGRT